MRLRTVIVARKTLPIVESFHLGGCMRLTALILVGVTILAGCASGTAASPSAVALPTAQPTSTLWPPASPSPAAALTYVAFGDSWPYGAHCNGCRPFPVLLPAGFEALSGGQVRFLNDVTNGGTAQELAEAMQTDAKIRADIAGADIIVIAIGGNDLGPAFDARAAGRCGGFDHLKCFRTVRDALASAYETMLDEIDALRAGRPTAVRMVTTSNEFLADPELIELFGPDFGAAGGVGITKMNRDVQCAAAAAHNAICIDLGLALNGPDLLTPQDVNTQATMQKVADAILAAGLPELGH